MSQNQHVAKAKNLVSGYRPDLVVAEAQAHALIAIAEEIADVRRLLEVLAAPRRSWWSRVMSR
jgi:hypothetical protein